MTGTSVGSDGWQLRAAKDGDIDEIMTWFHDADAVDLWGGPAFRFPFTPESFREDCRVDRMASFCLWSPDGRLEAFGQWYERDGRGHLARLIVHPGMRRSGAGRRLIESLLEHIASVRDYDEYSLFVYRHNEPAFNCYRRLGFEIRDYPADAPMGDRCFFLTKTATGANDDQ